MKFLFLPQVLAWAKQHQQRLASALAGLIAKQELLEALLAWLQWAETTLSEKDKEVIPQEIEEVKALIAEHQVKYGSSEPCLLDIFVPYFSKDRFVLVPLTSSRALLNAFQLGFIILPLP